MKTGRYLSVEGLCIKPPQLLAAPAVWYNKDSTIPISSITNGDSERKAICIQVDKMFHYELQYTSTAIICVNQIVLKKTVDIK